MYVHKKFLIQTIHQPCIYQVLHKVFVTHKRIITFDKMNLKLVASCRDNVPNVCVTQVKYKCKYDKKQYSIRCRKVELRGCA